MFHPGGYVGMPKGKLMLYCKILTNFCIPCVQRSDHKNTDKHNTYIMYMYTLVIIHCLWLRPANNENFVFN